MVAPLVSMKRNDDEYDRRQTRNPSRIDKPFPMSTPTEWGVVEVLARHPGMLVSQRQLLREVWVSVPRAHVESYSCLAFHTVED